MFDDGKPGEIFVRMSKAGSTIAGLMDCFAISVSMALQYGVPLPDLVQKYIHTRFDPSGVTNNKEIRFARSIMDYIFRWMALRFLNKEDLEVLGMTKPMEDDIRTETNGHTVVPKVSATPTTAETTSLSTFTKTFEGQADAPPCFLCGAMMVRNGNCYKCLNCGSTSGCS
jgi:ribonucleoside-diphosphate reductase alpha chain